MKSLKTNDHRPFLSLDAVTFRLGDRLVFENTSWVFHRSAHWAVVGENGSGKSLFAEALLGRIPLVRGAMRYQFQAPEGLLPEEAIGHVSFEERKANLAETVVQSRWNSLEEEGVITAAEFLSYERVMSVNPFEVTDRHRKARPRFKQRRARAIRLLGIAPLLPRGLLSLSNGEMQKLQLARALCMPLRMLILDEPFAGLDVGTRAAFRQVLGALMETALRTLIVTTRLEDLPEQVTHLMLVDRCRIAASGPRRAILSLPLARALLPPSKRLFAASGQQGQGRAGDQCKARQSGAELVRIRNGAVRYGNATILQGVNWTVYEGESWALLGANGSGKTTLLSLILGDNPQVYQNDVVVFGKRRGTGESIWDIKRRIGWVSPELHLCYSGWATCFAVVASGFHDTVGLFEEPTAQQRTAVRRSLSQFQLSEFAQAPFAALSCGQQRLVLLARALVKNPRLLILDEPCQGLDRKHREFFVNAVEKLIGSQATTLIYVTHRNDELPPSIERVLRLPLAGPESLKSSPPRRTLPRRAR